MCQFCFLLCIHRYDTRGTADWAMALRNHSMYKSVALRRWHVIVPESFKKQIDEFLAIMYRAADDMQYEVIAPKM